MRNEKVNRRTLAMAAIASMLLATTVISMTTTQNAFAARHTRNQAMSQTNACGNDSFPTNIGCQNTASQIQGDENAVTLAAQQTFPAGVSPPPTVTCEECFGILTADQRNLLQDILELSIDEICEALEAGTLSLADVENAAEDAGVTGATLDDFLECLENAIGLSNGST
jgi:hypothetical protein